MDEQRSGRKRRRRYQGRRKEHPPIENRNFPICPLCGKELREISSAIAERETKQPAHFDCVLKQLQEQEPVKQDEQYCYLGKGVFAVIKFTQTGQKGQQFTIVRKIEYEKEDEIPQWRKDESKRHLKL
jgi:hypothetical protein